MLKLSLSCRRFESNYSRVLQVEALKIYVAAVEALRKMETGDETRFYHQNWWKN